MYQRVVAKSDMRKGIDYAEKTCYKVATERGAYAVDTKGELIGQEVKEVVPGAGP
jgi:hypothetical protein